MPAPQARAPTPLAPAQDAAAATVEAVRDPRARWILALSAGGAVLLMGGIVALALLGPDVGSDAPAARPPAYDGHAAANLPALPAGCLPDPQRPPAMQVELGAKGVDFGAVRQGQVVHREVTFRSTGQGALCVRHVETGCGCVKAEIKGEQRRYEPGEAGVVLLTLDSAGRSGPQNKAFSIVTNELENPRRTFPATADVSLGVIASTHVLDFGHPRKGAAAKTTLRLRSPKADAPWSVTDVVAAKVGLQEPPAYVWEVKEVEDPALRVFDIVITHPGRTEDGMWQAPVVVKTSHPDRPEIHLQAVLSILPPVQAAPPSAMFGFVRSGTAEQTQRIVLRARAGTKFQVSGVRVDAAPGRPFGPEGAAFAVEQGAEPDGTPNVLVRYDGRARKAGLVEAVLVISTDVPEQPEIRVPLKATVAGAKSGR